MLTFGNNEQISWDGMSDLEHYEASKAMRQVALLRWSALARLTWRALSAGRTPSGKRPRLLASEFRSVLEAIHATASSADLELLLIVWPIRENIEAHRRRDERHPLQEELYSFGGTLRFGPDGGPGFVDLVPVVHELAEDHSIEELFQDPIHSTAVANRRYAQTVFATLDPWLESRLRPQ